MAYTNKQYTTPFMVLGPYEYTSSSTTLLYRHKSLRKFSTANQSHSHSHTEVEDTSTQPDSHTKVQDTAIQKFKSMHV